MRNPSRIDCRNNGHCNFGGNCDFRHWGDQQTEYTKKDKEEIEVETDAIEIGDDSAEVEVETDAIKIRDDKAENRANSTPESKIRKKNEI